MPKIKLTARVRLFTLLIAFALFTMFMFSYGYNIIEGQNRTQLDDIHQKKLELSVLEREQKNFRQGRLDIEELRSKDYPPQELFSRDTKVVKEIKQLEQIASNYNLEFTLQVTGAVETAEVAKGVTSPLLIVPYTVELKGVYANIQKYLEASQHTSFINHTSEIKFTADPKGGVDAIIYSKFYLKNNE